MPAIFVPPSGHMTITHFYTADEIASAGVRLAPTAEKAQIVVAALAEELTPYVQHFGSAKRYLLWCDEPLWSNIFQRLDRTRMQVKTAIAGTGEEQLVPVDVMNCFTGDVYFCNYHFLIDSYHIDRAGLDRARALAVEPLPVPGNRRIAAFLTYRNEGRWNFQHPSGIRGLNNLRSRLAMEGALFGWMDVYGKNWPLNLAKGEDRDFNEGVDPFALKLQRYRNYRFALCLENTWAPYYVTEKLWHAIIGGCLPIYYAGPNHTIYQDFPHNSFIDYHDCKDPIDLFEWIDKMDAAEYFRRLAICLDVLGNALTRSQEGKSTRRLRLAMFAERVASMADEQR